MKVHKQFLVLLKTKKSESELKLELWINSNEDKHKLNLRPVATNTVEAKPLLRRKIQKTVESNRLKSKCFGKFVQNFFYSYLSLQASSNEKQKSSNNKYRNFKKRLKSLLNSFNIPM